MYTVYLLESIENKKLYIGYTPAEINKRIAKHNRGEVLSTKAYKPWALIYCEMYVNRSDAVGREKFLKSGSGWRFLKKQLAYYFSQGLPRGE